MVLKLNSVLLYTDKCSDDPDVDLQDVAAKLAATSVRVSNEVRMLFFGVSGFG
ncbi:MAG: hypothetical protein HKK66_07360 [Chlorobiaceae bacterium]|nr:hypothetical protein [Chlorobiaceae bacterium]